jgi:peptidoglycan/LPS O-acetylase OafA/YrhL
MAGEWSAPTLHRVPEPSRRVGPWPALDGLRAFAVAAVVVYHLGYRWLPGGFLGVDVFFVLSGFLITSLLVDEWRRTRTIQIGQFYLRRARRLFPALYVMLAVVILATAVIASYRLGNLRGDVIAALFYVTNWTQIFWHQSYFQALGPPSLLEHLWSLAIEEQFYLIWPVVLIVCLSKRRKNLALTLAVVGIVVSTVLMWRMFSPFHDPSRVYYGSDTHAAPILIGAALALVMSSAANRSGRHTRRARRSGPPAGGLDALALAGAAVVAYFMVEVDFNDATLYHGGFVIVGLATAVVIVAAVRPDTRTAAALSSPVLRWIGVRSYAIYLWHWPIIQLTQPEFHPHLSGLPLNVARIAATVVISALSYTYVERPIRTHGFTDYLRGGARRATTVGRPLAAVVAVCAVVAVSATTLAGAKATPAASGPGGGGGARQTIVLAPRTAPATPSTTTATATPARATTSTSGLPSSSSAPPPPLTFPAVPGRPPFPAPVRVSFFGDSQAMTLIGARPDGLDNYLTVSNESIEGCGILGGELRAKSGLGRDLDNDCGDWLGTWTYRAEQDRPQIAAIEIGAWEVFDMTVDGEDLPFGSPAWDAYFDQQLGLGITALINSGAQVALIGVPCYQPTTEGWAERGDRTRTEHLNTLLAAAAAANPERVFLVQSAAAFCTDKTVMGNTSYRYDGTHFTAKGSAVEFEAIIPQLLTIPSPPR